MPDVSAVSVCPTAMVPVMVGWPLAGLFGVGVAVGVGVGGCCSCAAGETP